MTKASNQEKIEELFKANVHLGHRKNRLHPRAKRFVYQIINKTTIIDLTQTLDQIDKSKKFLNELAKENKKVLIVATKKVISQMIGKFCAENNLFYINIKWPPGLLTNFETIFKNVKKLIKLEEDKKSGAWNKYVKHEIFKLEKEITKLKKIYAGILGMTKKPDLIFTVDIKKEKNALLEAKRMNVPIMAITDTNSNPDLVDYPIVANDDSASSLEYLIKDLLNSYINALKK